MTPVRLAAIAVIYVIATLAWFALGTSVVARSGEFDDRLSREVSLLWGGPHVQSAPEIWFERPGTVTDQIQEPGPDGRPMVRMVTRKVTEHVPIPADSSRVDVALGLDYRKKGLLWYDTYGVRVRASYRARNPDTEARQVVAHLKFPADHAQYDNFVLRINGVDAERADDLSKGAIARFETPPGGDVVIDLAYDSRGLDTWTYAFGTQNMAQVKNFVMTMTTDFDRIDFPAGTMSPSTMQRRAGGWDLTWRFDNLLTGQSIGMDLPAKLNPGPLAARITYFAPVSLLFFLSVMVILGVIRGQTLHPMNYAFLSAAFFAFHLLLAYLVDHLPLAPSFVIASLASVLLVVSYLRIVAGSKFAIGQAGLAQMVFLVLFSFAFFFEGYTGLTVTVGAVVTLFVLMQLTARVDWTAAFAREPIRLGRSS